MSNKQARPSGKLIVIVAPSGTGKTSLLQKLQAKCPYLEWSVSSTTRPQRPGEQSGRDYEFISREKFQERIAQNRFIEWAEVHGNLYGTDKSFISQALEQGKIVLFDLDVQGALSIKQLFSAESYIIFIAPPSIKDLKKRLLERATDDEDTIEVRLSNASHELSFQHQFDELIVNDDFDVAFDELFRKVTRVYREVRGEAS